MFHKVTLIGNLGADPETRYVPSGANVCSFNVASNRTYTVNGERRKETTWFRVSAWGKLGEICQQYLTKGQLVLIEGELAADEAGYPRIWTDQNGQARSSFEIRAREMKMLGGRSENADAGGYTDEVHSAPAPRATQQAAPSRQQSAPAPAQQQRSAPAANSGGNRRSTMSVPQQPPADDFGDFGPEDIPF